MDELGLELPVDVADSAKSKIFIDPLAESPSTQQWSLNVQYEERRHRCSIFAMSARAARICSGR